MAVLFVTALQTEKALKRERVFRDRLNPLDSLADIEIVERYRLPRASIYNLCDLLQPDIANISNRSHAIPPIIKVNTVYLHRKCIQKRLPFVLMT